MKVFVGRGQLSAIKSDARITRVYADIIGAIFRASRVEVSPVDVVKSSYLERE
jgi:hypothetical protein